MRFSITQGEMIDLGGRRVLPGFVDAHLHPIELAYTMKQIACTPPLVNSIADLLQEIRQVRARQGADEWIECWGYDEGKFAEGRAPSRWDLDEAATDAPVVAIRACGHMVAVNSCVLELLGIDKNTPNPPGGEIDRDGDGEPTGIVRESARQLVFDIMPTATPLAKKSSPQGL